MIKDLTPTAIYMGILTAFIGYAASFAIVLAGLSAMGATPDQAATGLLFATLGMGLCSIWLPAMTRIPAAVTWTTPGAAFMAGASALPGGFGEAAGAMLICAGLIILTGIVPLLGRAVAAIPRPVANALLAGVILKLCLAPALALGTIPALVLPVLLAWGAGMMWHRLAAMPLAVAAFVVVAALNSDAPQMAGLLPPLAPVSLVFSWQAMISVSIPLYLVTMAGQNIPGFAVLELSGYEVNRQPMIRTTGYMSAAIAPFGGLTLNMSAITAAMMTGEDAGRDPARRYWAAIFCGMGYVALAGLAGIVTTGASLAPSGLITAMAGLALLPALANALSAAFEDKSAPEAPALTFVFAASGMTLWGISGAFWGLVIGVAVWLAKSWQRRS